MPRTNPERRRALTDAAIALLVDEGVHGVSHRAVERAAGFPAGTAANYFPRREELLVATAHRVVELHLADARAATEASVAAAPVGLDKLDQRGGLDQPGGLDPRADTLERMTDLLAASLLDAATRHRDRYLAIAELQLEARRRPALAAALAALATQASDLTATMHADTGLDVDPAAVPTLVLLYGGALLTLVTGAAPADAATTHRLARAMVHGALAPDP
ncbi:TetR/AcrR family transcriptional regulator [Krasilnikoviella flava]|uniref:Transcriptional regulator, TetR family n=1 Tax=Krasilnikoviella flava TaxID=526729 RepID=A0A1T5KZ91_9MICO|nr:TetR family transcriptional regulator [Krasilnikoviella flava]SKC68689.1 transcriptional regulator, TetR family [Krasilnikoviella flava]